MVGSFADNVSVELQERSVEYAKVFNQYNQMRTALLERMPAAERKSFAGDAGGEAAAPNPVAAVAAGEVQPVAVVAEDSGGGGGLIDLLGDVIPAPAAAPPPAASGGGPDDLLGLGLGGPMTSTAPPPAAAAGGGGGLMDLLGGPAPPAATAPPPAAAGGGSLLDLLGGPAPTPAAAPPPAAGGLMDLLGGPAAAPATPESGIPSILAWDKAGLSVKFDFSKNPQMPNVLQILLTATNSTPAPMENFLFQIAVPTTLQLQLQQQSASAIPAMNSGSVTQRILVNNPQKVSCSSVYFAARADVCPLCNVRTARHGGS